MESAISSPRTSKDIGPEHEEQGGPEARIQQGHISALFAFDVGYEVSLEKLANLLPSVPVQPLSPKKLTPTFTQYNRPPHVLNLGACPGPFGGTGQVRATLFDFGVVSLAYRWTLAKEHGTLLDDLPMISQHLYQSNLVAKARDQVKELVERVKPAIIRPNLSSIVEDYYLFVIERLGPFFDAGELFKKYRSV